MSYGYGYPQQQKPANYPLRKKLRDLIYDTPVEIAIGALVFGVTTGVVTYKHNNDKQGQIPLAFSEIGHTTRTYGAEGKIVPPLTRFYSITNDVAMKVFESNNLALAKGPDHKYFADELETRVDPALKRHTLISEYAEVLPADAQNALQSLDKYVGAARHAPAINNAFDNAWRHTSYEHTRTEIYYETVCSGTGDQRSCHQEMRTRQVCDYVTHTFAYDAQWGAQAAALLNNFGNAYPDMQIAERLIPASRIHPENEAAMARGLKQKFKDAIPTKEDILGYANTWAKGNNFAVYKGKVEDSHAGLVNLRGQWNASLSTARTVRINHSCYGSPSGPREYQIARAAEDYAASLATSSAAVVNGISHGGQAVPALTSLIKSYIGDVRAGREKAADKKRADIMKTTRAMYEKNFANGFDVNPFKWGLVVLITFVSTLFGAGLGTAADRYIDNRKRRGFFMDDQPEAAPGALKQKKTLRDLFGRKKPAATETQAKPKFDAPEL